MAPGAFYTVIVVWEKHHAPDRGAANLNRCKPECQPKVWNGERSRLCEAVPVLQRSHKHTPSVKVALAVVQLRSTVGTKGFKTRLLSGQCNRSLSGWLQDFTLTFYMRVCVCRLADTDLSILNANWANNAHLKKNIMERRAHKRYPGTAKHPHTCTLSQTCSSEVAEMLRLLVRPLVLCCRWQGVVHWYYRRCRVQQPERGSLRHRSVSHRPFTPPLSPCPAAAALTHTSAQVHRRQCETKCIEMYRNADMLN